MRTAAILCTLVVLAAGVDGFAAEYTTVSSELERMRSVDHLYRPQDHRILQYSGFSRKGDNPDKGDCLYTENGWRVVADQRGPGVVTRIWTTHRPKWGDIQVEVDGKIIFTGRANSFFAQNKLPFTEPLSEIRRKQPDGITVDDRAEGDGTWAVSYVPIPFEKRFRYLQRDKFYANIDVKAFPPTHHVESFLEADWDQLKPEFEETTAVWESMDLYGDRLKKYKRINKTINVPAAPLGSDAVADVVESTGPGIIRGIRIKTNQDSYLGDVDLHIRWDAETEPGIVSPLDYGFGSRRHRTLAIGQSEDGWRFCYLPMPFRKQANVQLASRATSPVICEVELFVEDNAALPDDVLYLHSYKNTGQFAKGGRYEKPNLPLKYFFYHNGYCAFSRRGSGHIVAYMDLFDCQPELDEHVFIDDERTFPGNSWNGTGHEDLFDMAWGHGLLSAPTTSGGSQQFEEANVKLFWNNPMTFRRAIRFNWEWAFRFGIPAPRDVRFASVVYWYGQPQ